MRRSFAAIITDDVTIYRITVRALRHRVPAPVRLKRLLKILLRAFRFRVIDVEELKSK